jgi:hypothetical protein
MTTLLSRFSLNNDDDKLLTQFYVTLRAGFGQVLEAGQVPKGPEDTIAQLLNEEAPWERAYQVEQQLAQLFDETTLHVELLRSLNEYKKRFSAEESDHFIAEIGKLGANDHRRARAPERRIGQKHTLLLQIVHDLQWFFAKRNQIRYLISVTRLRTAALFLGAFILFVLSLFVYAYGHKLGIGSLPIRTLLVATLVGALGATFSMLIGLKRFNETEVPLHELRVISRMSYLFIRSFTGVYAALSLFFFLQSQLVTITRKMLPKLPLIHDTNDPIIASYRDMLLVIV